MTRRLAVLFGIVALAIVVAGCDSDRRAISRDDLPDIPADPAITVEIGEAGFDPGEVEVQLGETVEFVNTGDDEHGIRTADSAIDTGLLLPGESVVIHFDTVGDHDVTDVAADDHGATITVIPPPDDAG